MVGPSRVAFVDHARVPGWLRRRLSLAVVGGWRAQVVGRDLDAQTCARRTPGRCVRDEGTAAAARPDARPHDRRGPRERRRGPTRRGDRLDSGGSWLDRKSLPDRRSRGAARSGCRRRVAPVHGSRTRTALVLGCHDLNMFSARDGATRTPTACAGAAMRWPGHGAELSNRPSCCSTRTAPTFGRHLANATVPAWRATTRTRLRTYASASAASVERQAHVVLSGRFSKVGTRAASPQGVADVVVTR